MNKNKSLLHGLDEKGYQKSMNENEDSGRTYKSSIDNIPKLGNSSLPSQISSR